MSNCLANYPKLAAQFDVAANGGRTPEQVVAGTHERLQWFCPVAPDHRWSATGDSRVRAGTGCPSCAGYQVSVSNCLANYPELAAQFDVAANGGRTPEQVVATTTEKLRWKCPVAPDHRWAATGTSRVRLRSGCPACDNKQVSVTNCLANYPELAAQFDIAANGGRTPDQIIAGTDEKLWWACPVAADHRWRASGWNRVAGGGCPACSGYQVSVSNCLANYPELAAQFDVAANGGRTPDLVLATTGEKLWWICPAADDHRWRARGESRVRLGSGCPHCMLVAVSAREVRLACELAAALPGLDVDARRIELAGHRAQHVDILDPGRMLAVEYDGSFWHDGERAERRDREKTARLVNAGYTVIRVREAPLQPITDADVSVRPTDPIHTVTAAVLGRIAELRPELLSTAEADAYRCGGREVAGDTAELRLRALRARGGGRVWRRGAADPRRSLRSG